MLAGRIRASRETMSTFTDITAGCPNCGTQQELTVARGINVARTPAARDAIMEGRFQRYCCSGCRVEFTVLRPFTYVDWSRAQMFGVFPLADIDEWPRCEQVLEGTFSRTLGDESDGAPDGIPDEIRLRTVFGLDALREKLLLFDAGMDDAVVEVMKLRWVMEGGAAERRRPLVIDVVADMLVVRSEDETAVWSRADYEALRRDEETVTPFLDVLAAGSFRDLVRFAS